MGDFGNGSYEADFVSPYTKCACNVDASIMVMLQDWVSADYLAGPINHSLVSLGRDPRLPTNRNLDELLQAHFHIAIQSTFATNLFPFVKPAGMNAPISRSDLVRAAKQFALPQIEIVRPRLVIVLGLEAFSALSAASGHSRVGKLSAAIEAPYDWKASRIWCQAHTGALGRANRNRGGIDRVDSDWARMREWYQGGV